MCVCVCVCVCLCVSVCVDLFRRLRHKLRGVSIEISLPSCLLVVPMRACRTALITFRLSKHWLETSRTHGDKTSAITQCLALRGSLTVIHSTLLRWQVELSLLPFDCAVRPVAWTETLFKALLLRLGRRGCWDLTGYLDPSRPETQLQAIWVGPKSGPYRTTEDYPIHRLSAVGERVCCLSENRSSTTRFDLPQTLFQESTNSFPNHGVERFVADDVWRCWRCCNARGGQLPQYWQ